MFPAMELQLIVSDLMMVAAGYNLNCSLSSHKNTVGEGEEKNCVKKSDL